MGEFFNRVLPILGILSKIPRQLLTVGLLGACCFSPHLSARDQGLPPGLVHNPSAGSSVLQPGLAQLFDIEFKVAIPAVAETAKTGESNAETSVLLGTTFTLPRIQQLRQDGFFGLALGLLLKIQQDDRTDRLDWERERWAILKESGLKAELLVHLRSILPSLEGGFRTEATLDIARLLLDLRKPQESRAVIRQMWIRQQPSTDSVLAARRLVIQSYLEEGRLDDANAACNRYQAEYYPDDPAWNRFRATLLLKSKKPGKALRYLAGLQDVQSQQLRALARLRDGSLTPQNVISRLQAIKESSLTNSETEWFRLGILVEAAERDLNWAQSAMAMELLLVEGVAREPLLAEVNLERLLRSYQLLSDRTRKELSLSDSAPGTWRETLAERSAASVTHRAIYLSGLLGAVPGASRHEMDQALVDALLDDGLGPLVFLLYGTTAPLGPVSSLADDLLYKLSRYALQRHDYALASSLNQALRGLPKGMTEGEWALRRSRVEIFAGHAEPGLKILLGWLGEVEHIAEDSLDRVIQVLFDLQTIGRHDLAIRGFQLASNLSRTLRQQREFLYWMAESQAAQSEHILAADLFLRSAAIGGLKLDQWAQSAQFRAAGELSSAGLINDARTLYRTLLRTSSDPKQRLALGQKIQDLDLRSAWDN